MPSVSELWAQTQFDLGMSLLADPVPGDYAEKLERALEAFLGATTVYSKQSHPLKWARIKLELGSIFLLRQRGDKYTNTQSAIQSYNEALSVYQQPSTPFEWAECQRGLGKAFFRLARALPSSFDEQALKHFHLALEVVTKDDWPELWHMIHLEMALVYGNSEDSSDAHRLAKLHYSMALSVDKNKYGELYDSMVRLHDLYSKLYQIKQELKEEEQTKEKGSDGTGRK